MVFDSNTHRLFKKAILVHPNFPGVSKVSRLNFSQMWAEIQNDQKYIKKYLDKNHGRVPKKKHLLTIVVWLDCGDNWLGGGQHDPHSQLYDYAVVMADYKPSTHDKLLVCELIMDLNNPE